MKKNINYSFFQAPVDMIIFVVGTVFVGSISIVGIVKGLVEKNWFFIAMAGIMGLMYVFFFYFFYVSTNRVIITDEKIYIKKLFGKVVTECRISEIKEVYYKKCRKTRNYGGDYFVIKDGRQLDKPYDYKQCGAYVKFDYTKKREDIIRNFWSNEIQVIEVGQDIPNG